MLGAVLSAVVTTVAVLLWTSSGVGLVGQPTQLSLSFAGVAEGSLHPIPVRAETERGLLSVPSTPFPQSHLPSVATALPSAPLVSAQSVAALQSKIAAGALIDSKHGADGDVLIVGVVNFGYIDFALNWLCFARRHGLHNYLLVAIDDRSVLHLNMLGYSQHVMHVQQLFPNDTFGRCGGLRTYQIKNHCFNKQTELKILIVLAALQAGHNAVLSDMDIAFVHNPLLYMPLAHYWEMQLEPQEWCTGLYFVQCNPFTLEMETQVALGVRRNPQWDDQVIFNKWIDFHRMYMPAVMEQQLFPLDRTLFPIGKDYGAKGAVVQHNNWMFSAGEKRERQRAHGLYLFNHNATLQAVEAWKRGKRQQGVNVSSVQFTVASDAAAKTRIDLTLLRGEWLLDGSLLQCDACAACDKSTVAVSPLRTTWPGKLLRESFNESDGYRGPSTPHA